MNQGPGRMGDPKAIWKRESPRWTTQAENRMGVYRKTDAKLRPVNAAEGMRGQLCVS